VGANAGPPAVRADDRPLIQNLVVTTVPWRARAALVSDKRRNIERSP
jgi:hypothetical protein